MDIDDFVTEMIERVYSLMVETERVNQSESGAGMPGRGMRRGHHLTNVKSNSHCLLIKEDIKVKDISAIVCLE